MYIDTHTHLYDETLITEIDDVIQRTLTAGVHKMYMPNCDSSTIAGMMDITAKWPENCYPMMGIHPCYVKDNYLKELDIVADWLTKHPFAAVGEIGLDYYWDKTHVAQQKNAFERQIDMALQYNLPIVIHSRESTQDCIDIVRKKQTGSLKGIFHCFSGSADEAQQITELGMHLGIGGVVTFKKSTLPEIIERTAMEYIVLETDAPYLAPVPYRGKRNESSYIPIIAAKIAEIKGLTIEEVAHITTANAEKIFAI
jgi:TatD DNase family protein